MKTIVSLSMLATMLALSVPASVAMADDHDDRRCSWVRKCHHDDGRRICEKVKVCRDRH